MVISSRTPEGLPNCCPVCGSQVRLEPSLPFGDAPCPACGHLLWFMMVRSQPHFYLAERVAGIRERVLDVVASKLGVCRESLIGSPAFLADLGADSLDVVELVMELEEEFDNDFPDHVGPT